MHGGGGGLAPPPTHAAPALTLRRHRLPRPPQIGFFALLLVEALANKGLLDLIGISTGKGLDIGL